MNDNFKSIFSKEPNEIINNDYYFNSDRDGDCFNENDTKYWLNERFKKNWNATYNHIDKLFDFFHKEILKVFKNNPLPFMEIACGPGMGLTPLILSENPQIPCLITDACSLVIKSWRKYIDENLNQYNIDLASFSVMDIPIKSDSIDIVTSFIGISSTRSGKDGEMRALKEVCRVLKKGGYFITIENEWTDLSKIEEVFRLWGKPIWKDIPESFNKTWQERFNESGFTIESCDKVFNRYFTKDDNELGEQAYKLGIKIGVKNTLFILKKL